MIKTDSQYSINCVTKWVKTWLKNGWQTSDGRDVSNKEFIEVIYAYTKKYNIYFEHVSAHTDGDDDDSIANAVADRLATKATEKAFNEKKGYKSKSVGEVVLKKGNGSKTYSNKSYATKKNVNNSDEMSYTKSSGSKINRFADSFLSKKSGSSDINWNNKNVVIELIKSKH